MHSFETSTIHAPPFRMWKDDQMERAYAAVESGVSIPKAAELYGVPQSTLHDRIIGKVDFGAKPGKKPFFY